MVRGKQARDWLQVTEARQGLFQAATEILHQKPERERERQAHSYSWGQRNKPCLTSQQREVKARHDLVARQVPCNILQDVMAEQVGSTMSWTWKIRLGWTFHPWEFPLGSGKKKKKKSRHHHAQSGASVCLFILPPRAVPVPGMPFLLSATNLCFSANHFNRGSKQCCSWFWKRRGPCQMQHRGGKQAPGGHSHLSTFERCFSFGLRKHPDS